jgi:WD40 repeat protein
MNIEIQHIIKGHADAVYYLCLGHEKHLFYSGSADHFVGCWNNNTGEFEQPLVKSTGSIYSLYHDSANQNLFVGERNGIILKVDLTKEIPPKAIQAHDGDVFSLIEGKDGQIISGGGDGHLKVWTKDLLLIKDFHMSNKNIRCIQFFEEDNEILVGLSDHTIRVLNADTFEHIQILEDHKNSVFTIEKIDSNRFISAGRDAVFMVWLRENNHWKNTETIPAHLYTVNHLSLSPNKKLLASASRDKTIKIWDAESLELLKVLDRTKYPTSHTHSVNRLLWLNDDTLISTGDDRKVISWKIS